MKKNKIITNEDIINNLSQDRKDKINKIVENNISKWGGCRENSGRKTIVKGKLLKFTKRVTEDEAKFIDYARLHNIDYNELMEG